MFKCKAEQWNSYYKQNPTNNLTLSERETVSESDAVFGNLNTPYTLLDLEKFMFELTLLLWFAQQPYYFRVILWPCIS